MAKNFKPSGDIRLKTDMAPFFGDDGNASLTEFYRGGTLVPNNVFNNGIPTSGEISMTDFRGATNESYDLTVSATPVNEGAGVTITLTTTNVPDGTVIHSRTSGIQIADVVDATGLDFPFTVNNNTSAVSFTVKNDFVSDGGLDSNGIPLAGNETATTTLYTDNSYGTPIGGDNGAVSWQIVDTSLSWYAVVTQPTISAGIYRTSGSATETRSEGYNSAVQVSVSSPSFIMNAGNNNPSSFSVTTSLDSSYGVSGRLCTGHQYSLNQHSNRTLYNGNSYVPATGTWANNTTNTSVQVNRYATFPTGLAVGAYTMVIEERGRFIFTEIGGQSRVLGATGGGMNFQTPMCHFQSTHILEVTEGGGG